MEDVDPLDELISTGQVLAPKGGAPFLGYNGELQPEYLAWRYQAMAQLRQLGPAAAFMLQELEKDDRGQYFYENSAMAVLGALKGAKALRLSSAQAPVRQYGSP